MQYNDLTQAQRILVALSLAEHMGDVNDDLPRLARLLGEPEPEWSDAKNHFTWPFYPEDEDDE